jgi:hypothetical protein
MENPMKAEGPTQKPQKHAPPHHISEMLKNEMDKANKQPPDPSSFLGRLRNITKPTVPSIVKGGH